MFFTNAFTKAQRKVLALSSLGGMLEYYDFIIYIFLAPMIEKVFFADSSSWLASLKTLAIFSLGYFIRPLGGIIFSHFGDRYGRKMVFMLTVIFMALPSFAIGLLPTPAQIGIAAPTLLLVCRMMQGLALGGELPAAMTYVYEHAPSKHRAFAMATLFFGVNAGLLLGSLVTTLITSIFTEEQLLTYGWRLPFLLGGLFGMMAIFLRRQLHETALFKALGENEKERIPFVTIMRQSRPQVIESILLIALGSVSVFLYVYWPQYLHQYMHYDFVQLMRLNTINTLILTVTILLGGYLSDRFGYRRVYLLTCLSIAALSWPLYLLLGSGNIASVALSYTVFSFFFGFIPSAYSSIVSGLFPTATRYSGLALSYNMTYAIFGGLSPLLCPLSIGIFHSVYAPAIYLIVVALMSGMACYWGGRKKSAAEMEIAAI